jgi:hypothetical protein
MTTPARARPGGDLEPGWSHAEANGYGPCYLRHVPGKGILRVVARGASSGGYAWYLSTVTPAEALSRAREGFAHPRDAMRDADEQVSQMPPRMFELLTPGEAQALYRKLATAHDWGRDQGDHTLGEVRSELFTQLRIQATDPSYHGPDPYEFHRTVREASRGAAVQAMEASPNRASWITWRPRRDAAHGPAHVAEFPGPVTAASARPSGSGPATGRQRVARPGRAAGQTRPRSVRGGAP